MPERNITTAGAPPHGERADTADRAAADQGAGTATTAGTGSGSVAATPDVANAGRQPPLATAAEAVEINCLMNARYHAMREAFLDTVHRCLMLGVILAGGGAVVALAQAFGAASWVNPMLAAAAALMGALDLTFDLSNRARTHALMKRRYFELIADLRDGRRNVGDTEACLHRYSADEEPAFHAALILAWNAAQESVYGDAADAYHVPWHHRCLQNMRRFAGSRYSLRPRPRPTA